jgi:hypothetical protein
MLPGCKGMLSWHFKHRLHLVLLCRYELQWMSPGAEVRLLLGGSCMAFCPAATAHEEASLLVVGTEGGRLLRCQVSVFMHKLRVCSRTTNT